MSIPKIICMFFIFTNIYAQSNIDEELLKELQTTKLPICSIPYSVCLVQCEEFKLDDKKFEQCDTKCEKKYRNCIDKELSD